jgi:hypothetical protein
VSYPSIITWLLNSDPAIRWQVMQDLLQEDHAAVQMERSLVARTGWGAELISQQTESGLWQGDDIGLMRTTYCLGLLKTLGVLPQDERVKAMLAQVIEVKWEYHGHQPFFQGEVETCVNGKVLEIGSYFGIRCAVVLERLLDKQRADGGWNCEEDSLRSSFHSTIAVLEGMSAYEKAFGGTADTGGARQRAEEYLLQRQLLRRLSTNEIIDKAWTRFHFPLTWHYDLLWGLDYLRAAGHKPDERMAEAIGFVRLRRHQNGRWPLVKPYSEDLIKFDMETQVGAASRWNTLRAMRVLKWYETYEADPTEP